jgi:hypothetical protein
LVEHVPMEDHDMKLNMIVSTDEVIRICRDWIDSALMRLSKSDFFIIISFFYNNFLTFIYTIFLGIPYFRNIY